MLKFRKRAFVRNVKASQMEAVLANRWGMSKWFAIHDDKNGNSQDMVVGFDAEGNVLEIGVTYEVNDEVIFHADSLTITWKNRYNESRKR